MNKKGTSLILALLTLLLTMGPVLARSDNIVYGSNWAFVSVAPEGWSTACCDHAMKGTNVTLWPSNQKPDAADALIYVTVSDKDPGGLQAFAKYDEETFAKSSAKAKITLIKGQHKLSKYQYLLVRYDEPDAGRVEFVTYLAGPNMYYMIVLTANSAITLERYKHSYFSYVNAFIPMVRK